jgi:hypothetical protein
VSERKAKARRRSEAGVTEGPGPNFTDLDDTRADRRLKKFRPREYARQLEGTNPMLVRAQIQRWNRAFKYLPEKLRAAHMTRRQQ